MFTAFELERFFGRMRFGDLVPVKQQAWQVGPVTTCIIY